MQRKKFNQHILALGVAAALVSIGVFAQQGGFSDADIIEAASPDLPTRQQAWTTNARALSDAKAGEKSEKASAPTIEDVGDVDSFRREAIFLGVAGAFVSLEGACPPPDPAVPNQYCQAINPTPGAPTGFAFNDVMRIKLPGKSTHSLLCYWFSPVLTTTYNNPTASRVTAQFRYTPTLTVENPVLDDPALIDPTTGAPFGGKLLTSMTSSEIFQVPLESGVAFTERTRDSTVCMAGFLTRRALVDNYGLTEDQAKEFFKQPTTVRLNVSGNARYVDFAGMNFGLRIVGDKR
jgi:hypothetical protein